MTDLSLLDRTLGLLPAKTGLFLHAHLTDDDTEVNKVVTPVLTMLRVGCSPRPPTDAHGKLQITTGALVGLAATLVDLILQECSGSLTDAHGKLQIFTGALVGLAATSGDLIFQERFGCLTDNYGKMQISTGALVDRIFR